MTIVPFPGGADGLVKNVLPSLAIAGFDKAAVLLDGDQSPTTRDPKRDVGADLSTLGENVGELTAVWKEQFHVTSPNLYSDSDHGRDVDALRASLQWAGKHLGYLPNSCPEQALAASIGEDDPSKTKAQWKEFWVDRTRHQLRLTASEVVTSSQILALQQFELSRLPIDSALLEATHREIVRIIDW